MPSRKTLQALSLVIGLAFGTMGCAVAPLTMEQSVSIRSAAASALQRDAKVDVVTERGPDRETMLVISARLLDGFSPSETNPAIKAQYNSLAGLTNVVQARSVQILRAVDANGTFPEVERVMVETRHGVRLMRPGQVYGGSDVSKVIYAVSIAREDLLGNDLGTMNDEQVAALWRVETNILPRLQIQRPSLEDEENAVRQADARRPDAHAELPLP